MSCNSANRRNACRACYPEFDLRGISTTGFTRGKDSRNQDGGAPADRLSWYWCPPSLERLPVFCWSTPLICRRWVNSNIIVPAPSPSSTTIRDVPSAPSPCSAGWSLTTTTIPEVLRQALISIEDKDFYRHWGINVWRIAGAAIAIFVSGGRVQGASTLTMQLARNLFLSPDRSFHRKIQEALLAVQIERRFTKPQIFTLYANQIYLGHGVYGFEAASEFYFSKPAKQLTLDEAALLAGLPKSPTYYSPIVHPDHALKRRNLVINSMLEDGMITAEQAAALAIGRFTWRWPTIPIPWRHISSRRSGAISKASTAATRSMKAA